MLKQPFLKKALFNKARFNALNSKSSASKSSASKLSAEAAATSSDKSANEASPAHDAETPQSSTDVFANKPSTSQPSKRFSKRKASFALAILGAGSGLAFTQVSPEALKEALPKQNTVAPLRQAGDPPIEPMPKGNRSLFLTNEIFYRKIEAIAQVPRTQPNATASNAPSKQNNTQNQTSKNKPATTGSDKPAKSTTQKNASPAKPAQPEKVIAAAPPAPQAAPVPFEGITIDNVLEMRVAVAKDVRAISLATSGKGTITDLNGNPLKSLSPESSVLTEINGGITVDGQPMPSAFWVYPEDGGYVAVGSSWYRGRALVALRERGLIAVNYVLLGDYLYSVVGTEVSPDWPIESMKAQAVAARSYALTHNISPASEAYFDLDNTQRFQAYKGISREANTTVAAVQATSGEFISHDGGIVESLYAASQAIVDDAHKGSGMSQLGAKDLASQGYSYTEILAHYYPGTGLGRIETDTD